MRVWWAFLLLISVMFFNGLAFGQPKVYLDITSPSFRRLPLAIAEFKNLGLGYDVQGLRKKIQEVISNDLEMSGLFQLLDPALFLEDPRRAGITKNQTDFRDWSAIGAEALVKGGLYIRNQELKAEFRLYDVYRHNQISGVRYSGILSDWRRMAHKFANEIIATFTGEKGIFDTKIAFVGEVGKAKEIFIMDYDGYNVRRLTHNDSISVIPSWSPDGEKLLFTSYVSGNPDLYLAGLDGGKVIRLSRWPGLNLGGRWSAPANRIVLTLTKDGNPEVYTMKVDGSDLRRLTNHWGIDVSTHWSPDGKQLAFVSDRSGRPQIYIMKANGSKARRLTFKGRYNASPVWSPRGDKIAFTGVSKGRFSLFLINTVGSGLVQLTADST
ncbi:MAG: Tol-Pal system beta propeller repeat protein TolB, partial [Thermodesulfobacteriota bacterium]